ncbi:hypothetical protein [Desulfocurvibacter africanus]|nr:hypothetical protein [Desulfocurvibacter africanus]
MTQLDALIITMEQVRQGRDAVEAAHEYLRRFEGATVRSVRPQSIKRQVLRLAARGVEKIHIAQSLNITLRRVEQILSEDH